MDDEPETNEELVARHKRVKEERDEVVAKMERLKNPAARTRKAQWAGSLLFTLLGIESEMRERGLRV